MGKIIAVISGKGGVGKTTTAINLGAALNSLSKEVIIVDLNLKTPNIGIHLGAPITPINLNHVLKGKAEIEEVIYEHYSGTKVIPSALTLEEISGPQIKRIPFVIRKIRDFVDYIILDSAAGFSEEVISSIETGDEIIIVTNPELPAVTDALKAIRVVRNKGKDIKGVIITRYKGEKYEMSLNSIKNMLEVPVIGVVPEDKAVKKAIHKKDAVVHVHPNSKAAKKYKEIAHKINGTYEKKENIIKKLFSILNKESI